MGITPRDFAVINAFLGGRSRAEIAADHGVSSAYISEILKKKQVAEELARRLDALGERVLSFKLNAFDHAEKGLKKLSDLIDDPLATNELKRLAALDCVKIAGMMPRKRILVEANNYHGIDEDTRDFIQQVLRESASVVDVEAKELP